MGIKPVYTAVAVGSLFIGWNLPGDAPVPFSPQNDTTPTAHEETQQTGTETAIAAASGKSSNAMEFDKASKAEYADMRWRCRNLGDISHLPGEDDKNPASKTVDECSNAVGQVTEEPEKEPPEKRDQPEGKRYRVRDLGNTNDL